jgi:S-DNA-T family DNA segregation ATPase FtsK/SpoIIIE
MILSMLYRLTPDQCRFIMIDPKMVELSVYNDIPHLLTPVVTDPKKAVAALKWAVREMENRYRLMSELGVRNINNYNDRAAQANKNGEVIEIMQKTGFDRDTGQIIYEKHVLELRHMPFIVVVIDEMADLMMIAGKEIEGLVQRLAQMARAVGIHLITATQRPSVDVITGTIKANFPTRISYMVTSKTDSRVILGFDGGAEQLLGQGDLLFVENGGKTTRLHGPFVSDKEVGQIVAALKAQGKPEYFDDITNIDDEGDMNPTFASNSGDELFDKAVEIIARDRKVSTSYLQRKLSIGYNRAADLVDRLEREGMISAADHVGRRQILLPDHNM